jgi:hypothetical protein
MKIQVKVSPKIIVELEAEKQKDLFFSVASAFEVFGSSCCGLCGSTDIVPVRRTVTTIKGKKTESWDFAEYHCQAHLDGNKRCGARLSMGTINDDTGTLFPVRRLVNGERPATKAEKDQGINGDYGDHNGWHRFKGKAGDDE